MRQVTYRRRTRSEETRLCWIGCCLGGTIFTSVFLSFIRVVVQGRRANMPENPRGLREVSQCSIFSTARWCIFESRLILPIQGYPCPGFLICVPMQEEWASEEGVKVLDGWSFQVIVQHYSSRVCAVG